MFMAQDQRKYYPTLTIGTPGGALRLETVEMESAMSYKQLFLHLTPTPYVLLVKPLNTPEHPNYTNRVG